MKNWKWWILGIVLILFMPVIPYEEETNDGVVEVGNQPIAFYLHERYQEVQKQKADRIMEEVKKQRSED